MPFWKNYIVEPEPFRPPDRTQVGAHLAIERCFHSGGVLSVFDLSPESNIDGCFDAHCRGFRGRPGQTELRPEAHCAAIHSEIGSPIAFA